MPKNSKKSPSKKVPAKQSAASTSRRLTGSPTGRLSSSWKLFSQTAGTLHRDWRLLGGITLVYGLLDLFFVHGLSRAVNFNTIKSEGVWSNGFQRVSALFGTNNTNTAGGDVAALYQSILIILASLATIWALRQLQKVHEANKTSAPTVKQAYYNSTYPAVPFALEFLIISVQLLPMVIGGAIYSTVIGSGAAQGWLENSLWFLLFFGLSVWTLYMLTATVFGLFIVTLPNMTPLKAWRSARKLVAGRRWKIMRKLLALPVVMALVVGVVIWPIAVWLAPIAEWVFLAIGAFGLTFALTYLYNLYRELL